jgi:autotransporter-associated beta strand protein
MKVRGVISKISRNAMGFAILGISMLPLKAAIVTWDGGGGKVPGNWSGNGANGDNNWNPNGAPVNGDSLIFAGNTLLDNTNNIANLQIVGMEFASGAGAFILGGNQLTFTAGGITNNSTNLQTINIALGLNATITIAATTGNVALGGVVSGAGGITKSGANALYLTGPNTYAGTTTISVGTLFANNSSGSATGTGAVSVTGTLGGTGTIAPTGSNGIIVNSGGIIAPGDGSTPGTLIVNLSSTSGGIFMNSGSGFQFNLGAAGISDVFALVGAGVGDFTFNNNNINFLGTGAIGTYKLFDTSSGNANTWNGLTVNGSNQITSGLTYSNLTSGYTAVFHMGGGSYGGDNGDIYVQVIPEPDAAILIGLGVLIFVFRHRRSRA